LFSFFIDNAIINQDETLKRAKLLTTNNDNGLMNRSRKLEQIKYGAHEKTSPLCVFLWPFNAWINVIKEEDKQDKYKELKWEVVENRVFFFFCYMPLMHRW
jgi:hypothetical protein